MVLIKKSRVDETCMTYPEQGAFHVVAHLVVVQGHDLHQALKGADLNVGVRVLSSLANDLHDVVSLALYQV